MPRACDPSTPQTGNRCASLAKYSLGLYLVCTNFGVLVLVMRDGQIKPLMLGVVTHVIDHAYCRQAGDDFAALRVEDNQLSRISGGHKQTVVRFVKSHGHVQFVARRQRPSGRHFRLVPVEDPDHALASKVQKHAWSGLLEDDRFDMVSVDFYIA